MVLAMLLLVTERGKETKLKNGILTVLQMKACMKIDDEKV
jgi:hypothetical protein